MAWETRGKRRCYYRTSRLGDKVLKKYFGHGAEARAAALQDSQERAERKARLQDKRQRQRDYEAVLQIYTYMATDCDNLVRASLLNAGYHQHARGKWRMRRCESKQPKRQPE